MQVTDGIFYILVLIMSVVIHEVAHGYVAYLNGDDTARLQGRLTLNPLKHLDLVGSVLLPLMLIILNTGIVFGWAKPVPYNPNNFRNRKKGIILVSIAGIVANLCLAVIFGLLIHFGTTLGLPAYNTITPDPFYRIATSIVIVNLILALFNLIPVPPLDGSKVLFEVLPVRFHKVEAFLSKWGLFIMLLFILFLWQYFSPIIFWAFGVLTGIH